MKAGSKIFSMWLVMILTVTHLFAQKNLVAVAKDGSGDFSTIGEAINSLPVKANAERVILIKKGIYREKIFIDKDHITLRGEDPSNTIVTISLAREEWRCQNPDDYGTATINLKGNDIRLENLSFVNSYGKDNTSDRTINCATDSSGSKTLRPGGHQMALRSFNTTRLVAVNCVFRAYGGDTVSPWNTDDGMFYFKNCTMEGGVDFYCPRGWALAENCHFICHSTEAAIWHDGSKNESSKTVLMNCSFTGDDHFKLGRYHRDAQFYLFNCHFAANMADADIYQRESTPPNKIQWGRRVYYYNCHREGGDYPWLKNNLPSDPGINEITSAWIFDYKWNPIQEEEARVDQYKISPPMKDPGKDPVAENMLLYQRKNGGWPKHFQGDRKVDYNRTLTRSEKKELHSGYTEGMDATIDNDATSKEIRYLAKAYKKTGNAAYLEAVQKGVAYLLKAQYPNGGWPQFYPDFSSYRSQVTYNDNAMVNALNILRDVAKGRNDLEVVERSYAGRCNKAVEKGIECILKTQIRQKGKLTAWCAQYNAKTLVPEMARKYELPSLSGNESVGIVKFLMGVENPPKEIIEAINGAVEWFDKVKIKGYRYIDVPAPNEPSGRDRVFVPDSSGGLLWARFYDLETNEPFFCGRDSQRKKTIAEVENERRIGYAWYGNWPGRLLSEDYPKWAAKWLKK
jgi:PelA/Pel-15E family pectate lyase